MSKFFVEEQGEKILLSQFIEMIKDDSYAGYLSHPKEVIAKNVEWLIDDQYTTGQVISINGGWIII